MWVATVLWLFVIVGEVGLWWLVWWLFFLIRVAVVVVTFLWVYMLYYVNWCLYYFNR